MASKTEIVEVVGKVKWAKLFGFNRDKSQYSEATDGITCLNVYTNAEGRAKLKASGTQVKPKLDEEDNEVFYRFKRPWKTDYDWQCGAPKVYDAAGNEWDAKEMGLIGNGSVAIVTISVYETSKGKGTRLEAVQILKHVKYESEDGGDEDGGSTGGYVPRDFTKTKMDLSEFGVDEDDDEDEDDVPQKPAPKTKSTAKKTNARGRKADDLDDSIPF